MELRCEAICTNNKGKMKSNSPAFKDLQIGDRIQFSIPMKAVGDYGRTYAAYINCYNTRTEQTSRFSFNQIEKILNNFEFKECE